MDFRIPYFIILLSAVIIGFIKFKSLTKAVKCFYFLVIFTTIIEFFAFVFAFSNRENIVFYNLFIPFQFTLISLGFYSEIRNKNILLSTLIFFVFYSIQTYNIGIFHVFNTSSLIFNFFLTTLFSLNFFYNLLKKKQNALILNFPMFWISGGLLIFCVSNLFVFGTYNLLLSNLSNNSIENIFNFIRVYSNYLLYILIGISFIVRQLSINIYYVSR